MNTNDIMHEKIITRICVPIYVNIRVISMGMREKIEWGIKIRGAELTNSFFLGCERDSEDYCRAVPALGGLEL
jgi:hypothetical protein